MRSVGEQLRQERETRGLSMREVGRRASVRASQVQRLEETGWASQEVVLAVCSALGVRLRVVMVEGV